MAGEYIFNYVHALVGEDRAPRITGLLIDLNLDEIKAYLRDYNHLVQKVREAMNFI